MAPTLKPGETKCQASCWREISNLLRWRSDVFKRAVKRAVKLQTKSNIFILKGGCWLPIVWNLKVWVLLSFLSMVLIPGVLIFPVVPWWLIPRAPRRHGYSMATWKFQKEQGPLLDLENIHSFMQWSKTRKLRKNWKSGRCGETLNLTFSPIFCNLALSETLFKGFQRWKWWTPSDTVGWNCSVILSKIQCSQETFGGMYWWDMETNPNSHTWERNGMKQWNYEMATLGWNSETMKC